MQREAVGSELGETVMDSNHFPEMLASEKANHLCDFAILYTLFTLCLKYCKMLL